MHRVKFLSTFLSKGVYKSKSFIYNINMHKGCEREDTVRVRFRELRRVITRAVSAE